MDISTPILYINLDKSINRNNNINSVFEKHKIIKFNRISAFDGILRQNEYIKSNLKIDNRDIHPSEYGCLISHLLCYKYFIENIKEDICLILEDDINFNYSKYYYTYFSEYIRDIPDDFDIIQLSVILRNSEYNDFINPCLYQNKYYFSTGAYLIKKSALRILNSIPCNNNIWDFSKLKLLPLADHYIYNSVNKVYSIPLISLNIPTKNDMTIIRKEMESEIEFQTKSYNVLRNNWKIV